VNEMIGFTIAEKAKIYDTLKIKLSQELTKAEQELRNPNFNHDAVAVYKNTLQWVDAILNDYYSITLSTRVSEEGEDAEHSDV
jgi:hypothetical protein